MNTYGLDIENVMNSLKDVSQDLNWYSGPAYKQWMISIADVYKELVNNGDKIDEAFCQSRIAAKNRVNEELSNFTVWNLKIMVLEMLQDNDSGLYEEFYDKVSNPFSFSDVVNWMRENNLTMHSTHFENSVFVCVTESVARIEKMIPCLSSSFRQLASRNLV